ncbi:MAG: D-alanyl-D-alanine carboxypeptidase/D-alanyl-D-alanine-endopeptidase [Gemmatimonadales bacterium]
MMRVNLWKVALLAAAITGPAASQQTLDQRIQAVMERPEFRHASWGVEFYDLTARLPVYSVNPERLFVPGSSTKLLTVGTSLELLGRDHRFTTRVYRTGTVKGGTLDGDLVLVASGDPNLSGRGTFGGDTLAWTDEDHSYGGMPLAADPLSALRDLAKQVAAHGIKRIKGRVMVDATLFREGSRDLGTNVVLSPMVVNDNVVDIIVTPGAAAGAIVDVKVLPLTSYVVVDNKLTTGAPDSPRRVRVTEDSSKADVYVVHLEGSVPAGSAPVNSRRTVASPRRFGEVAFAMVLNEAGVRCAVRPARDSVDYRALAARYADSAVVAQHASVPFSAEATAILKMSQNLHASQMPMLWSKLARVPDSTRSGFDLEHDWLQRAGLDLGGADQADGAGGDAFFSPSFMVHYLEHVTTRPWYADFRRALPVLGKDGTLAAIQKSSVAAGNVFAKTGTYSKFDALNRRQTVHGKALAGYFTSKGGRKIAFAIFLNNLAVERGNVTDIAGQALGEIAGIAWEFMP